MGTPAEMEDNLRFATIAKEVLKNNFGNRKPTLTACEGIYEYSLKYENERDSGRRLLITIEPTGERGDKWSGLLSKKSIDDHLNAVASFSNFFILPSGNQIPDGHLSTAIESLLIAMEHVIEVASSTKK